MKKTLTFSLLLLISIGGFAQSRTLFECIYEYSLRVDDENFETSTILIAGDNTSLFEDYSTYCLDSVKYCKAKDEVLKKYKKIWSNNIMLFDQSIVRNNTNNTLTVFSPIVPNTISYVEKAKETIKWHFTEGEKEVCGYKCMKATMEYGGREWTAWYAMEIPSQYGPWKFSGLPGLILEAVDNNGIHKFTAISIRKGKGVIRIPEYANIVKTSREKFIERKNKFEENPLKNLPVESLTDIMIEKNDDGSKNMYANGMLLRIRKGKYIPLELK